MYGLSEYYSLIGWPIQRGPFEIKPKNANLVINKIDNNAVGQFVNKNRKVVTHRMSLSRPLRMAAVCLCVWSWTWSFRYPWIFP